MRHKTEPTRAIDEHVGKHLRMMRAARGLTQEQLAEKLGISYQQLHKYETGANSISAGRLYELAMLLGTAPDAFFHGLPLHEQVTSAASLPTDLLSREQATLLKYLAQVPQHKRSALLGLIRSVAEPV